MESAEEPSLKLRYSLSYWQKWETEYEALKDEVEDLEECTTKKLVGIDPYNVALSDTNFQKHEIAQELGSDLVTAKGISGK